MNATTATQQIGGSSAEKELQDLTFVGDQVPPISEGEYCARRTRAGQIMREKGLSALILTPGANLAYFTGLSLHRSERLTSAVLREDASLAWICPQFETPNLKRLIGASATIAAWEEDENPFFLLKDHVGQQRVAIDDSAPYWLVQRTFDALGSERCVSSTFLTGAMRMIKSSAEIAIIEHAMKITLEVQRRTARILRNGISASEVRAFMDEAHLRLGGSASTFSIVSFGEETAYPHGGTGEATLAKDELVLIDTGTVLHGYQSDITRTYAFGRATERQRRVWRIERDAQYAAFFAAKIGATCESVDNAARSFLAEHGFGPDYKIPGLPHRTGHGLGLEIHEEPYLVRGNRTPLAAGMCF